MNRNDILAAAQKANAYKSSFDWYAFDENELVRFVKHCIDTSITSTKRQPLTEKQIESAVCNAYAEKALTRYDITIARAIERAHGIGG